MHGELLLLRLLHVLGGVLWVGSLTLMTFFLLPALKGAGPAAGPVMIQLQKRKLFVAIPVLGLLTMLAGIRLMAIVSGGFSRDYFATNMGRAYGLSGVLAIVGFLIGVILARPAAARVVTLSQMAASDGASKERIANEISAMQRRTAKSSMAATVLLLLSAVGMAIARYL